MGYEFLNDRITILDGAMGSVLQQRGLPPGGIPELLNLTDPELLISIYREYIDAGSEIIYANTFGANGKKLRGSGHSVEEIISAAIAAAKKAAEGTNAKVALDIGMEIPEVPGKEILQKIDLAQIMALIGQGVVGHLVEMTSADGDRICIYVE